MVFSFSAIFKLSTGWQCSVPCCDVGLNGSRGRKFPFVMPAERVFITILFLRSHPDKRGGVQEENGLSEATFNFEPVQGSYRVTKRREELLNEDVRDEADDRSDDDDEEEDVKELEEPEVNSQGQNK
ncbi:hypothetical protein OJAV_G00234290 [Oryzias javanicus]|uniref:Uncharacterized protein n=1 Tax=Oryzias javanicus TaxID=123683 RepID=A0A437BZZ9_ORYJA|nr:hypothetical protein OJAV_G00234290 [Oryzias javanicus]